MYKCIQIHILHIITHIWTNVMYTDMCMYEGCVVPETANIWSDACYS